MVRQAKPGERFEVLETRDDWFKVAESPQQWIHSSVVLTEAEKRQRDSAQIELIDWSWSSSHGYVTAEGQVRNVSSSPIRGVMAEVSFFTKDGTFITSNSTFIEYQPIMPGQTSPFKVMERENPQMNTARITFKEFAGGELNWYKR